MLLQKHDKLIVFLAILIILFVTVFGTIVFLEFIPTPIHNATVEDLTEIQGIGEIKAELILNYLKANKEAEISDLEGIDGIGSILVERIDKAYR